MAKEDTSAGLLSKMVKFVRNPATSWTELDNKETDRDEAVSKLLLKEMIERKRSNDFVRKREFDMLRKMRKREAMVGQDQGGRPSFFQSSMPSKPDDRAQTIKKIDEIEAQMSMQWWKTKNGAASSLSSAESSNFPSGNTLPPPAPPRLSARARADFSAGVPQGYGATEPIGLEPLTTSASASASTSPAAPASAPVSVPVSTAAFASGTAAHTTPVAATPLSTGQSAANTSSTPGANRAAGPTGARFEPAPRQASAQASSPKPMAMNVMAASSNSPDAGASGFTYTNMMAMDVQEIAHDAELEEASISFANSDDVSAEATLLEMLAPGGSRAGQSEIWMTLFDLYRATDQQEKFENTAIKFVQKFDRSAPQWFSMPAMVKQLAGPAVQAPIGGQTADWICSSTMGIQTVAAMKAALAKAPMPWRLNWNNLKTIEASAVEPLSKVFANWASQPVKLRFMGGAHFEQLLQNATPSGDRSVSQDWWQLRMEALRVTHRPDEFEMVALDFCVTYEVSPPAWEVSRCEYKPMDNEGVAFAGHTIIGDVYRDSLASSLSVFDGDTQMDEVSSQMSSLLSVELSGQIEGDAIAMLEQLETKLMGADIMVISCAKLIRVDFSAAGTLLNWVSARQAENRAVQFSDVNRLVAAFFNVIGITEHAKVISRKD